MDWQQLVYDVILALVPVLTTAIIALIGAGFTYLRARYEWMQEARTVAQVESTLYALVQEANQELVDKAKAAREDGKLTPEEAEEIKREVIARFYETLTAEQKKVLLAITDDVNRWISAKIEQYVVAAKQSTIAAQVSALANPPSPSASR